MFGELGLLDSLEALHVVVEAPLQKFVDDGWQRGQLDAACLGFRPQAEDVDVLIHQLCQGGAVDLACARLAPPALLDPGRMVYLEVRRQVFESDAAPVDAREHNAAVLVVVERARDPGLGGGTAGCFGLGAGRGDKCDRCESGAEHRGSGVLQEDIVHRAA